MPKGYKGFQKGVVTNPKGRPPALIPEVKAAIEANKAAIKVVILKELEGNVENWIKRIISQGTAEGDVLKFKLLIELALGKMVVDEPEFPLTEEEKALVLEFRRRKNELTTIVST